MEQYTDPVGKLIGWAGLLILLLALLGLIANQPAAPVDPQPVEPGTDWGAILGVLLAILGGLVAIERVQFWFEKRRIYLARYRLKDMGRVDVQLLPDGYWEAIHDEPDPPPIIEYHEPPKLTERAILVNRYEQSFPAMKRASDSRQRRQMQAACKTALLLADQLGGFSKRQFMDVGISEAAYTTVTHQLEAVGALERVDPNNPRRGWQRVNGMDTDAIMKLSVWDEDYPLVAPPPPGLTGEIVTAS